MTPTPEDAPKLVHVLLRASTDTAHDTNIAKEFYQRHRPYTIDHVKICQPGSELYDNKAHRVSYDYPSGHTTGGWTYALVLSALAPDRVQQIMERGRGYGDSRFVCGARNESAVEAGILSASATMALVSRRPPTRSISPTRGPSWPHCERAARRRRAVRPWQRGYSSQSATMMIDIVARSRGRVS